MNKKEKNDFTPDIVFIWSNWLVALLQSILFFRNMFKMPTHVQIRYNQDLDLSAEPGGVKFVKHIDIKKKRRSEVYKFPREITLDQQKIKHFREICQKYIDEKYDFFIYFRWHLHVSIAYVPIFLLIGWIFNLYSGFTMILIAVLYVILGLIGDRLLKIFSSNTTHCNELAMKVYREAFDLEFYPGSQEKTAPFISRLIVRFSNYSWTEVNPDK